MNAYICTLPKVSVSIVVSTFFCVLGKKKPVEIMDDVEERKNLSKKRRIPPTNVKVSFPNGKTIFFGYGKRKRRTGMNEQLQNKMNCRVLPLNGVLNEVVDQR